MAKSRMPASKGERRQGFMTSLASASMEWLLMFFLFLNGVFSYLILKFARHCNLPLPCLLCSRLDNVLSKQKVEYFQELFCGNHKREITTLVLCHAHSKLVDVHKMCETCLFSFASVSKPDSQTYRLLVGKLGDDPDYEFEDEPMIDGKKHANKMKHCCCCNDLWCPKSYRRDLLKTFSVNHEASHLDRELLLDIDRDTYQHQRSRKEVDVRDDSQLYHVGYTELKVTSDTESELMINEFVSTTAHYGIDDHKLEEPIPRIITLVDDFSSEKLINPSSDLEPSVLVALPNQDNVISALKVALESTVSMHGLEELNWHHVEPKTQSSSKTELKSFENLASQDDQDTVVEDVKASDGYVEKSEVKQTSVASNNDSAESSEVKQTSVASNNDSAESFEVKQITIARNDAYAESSEVKHTSHSSNNDLTESSEVKHASLASNDNFAENSEVNQSSNASNNDCVESSEVKQTSLESNDDFKEKCEVNHTSFRNDDEGPKEMVVTVNDSQPELKNDSDLQSAKSLDFGDAYNIAISSKGKQISSNSFVERNVNNSAKISEDLKQLLSQISRGTDVPAFDMSPRVSRNVEELRPSDSSSVGIEMLQKRFSLERNESGLESFDGSVSEVEGESLVDLLKRQIEHDKKLLLTMYKELEEERSASAIAANQAMAMITRLQEEKAALHMDASQYLRMMEEQAEYDMEALQNCNDLLSEREIEIQALEAELEHYRSKYPDEATLLAKLQSYYSMGKDSKVDQSEGRVFEDRSFSRNVSFPRNVEVLRTSFRNQVKSSFLERESARSFASEISNKLKELSEYEGDLADVHDDHAVHREDTELPVKKLDYDEELKDGMELENNASSNQMDGSTCNEIPHLEKNSVSDGSSSEKQVSCLDVNHDTTGERKSSPKSPENQHKGWHIVEEIDLEEDKGKGVEC